ncbi:hypothetical protein ACFW16_01030 [Inquilinus sp. NPDC058860]|uniref:hypothetical protein n=1 Tax=Inquilinus sp. NPDC058860 TaxID=3346652 RepID=UPI003686456B
MAEALDHPDDRRVARGMHQHLEHLILGGGRPPEIRLFPPARTNISSKRHRRRGAGRRPRSCRAMAGSKPIAHRRISSVTIPAGSEIRN